MIELYTLEKKALSPTPGIVHCRLVLLRVSAHLISPFVPGQVSASNSATSHTRKRLAAIAKKHSSQKNY